MIGKMLGHYQITEKLGEGGMGVVYKARDTHLDRFVAIKTLPPERVADPDRKRRFVQEAKAASALNHPNIITIYDIDQAEGIDYIAMEYVPGKTLDELIPRKGMRLSQALKYAVQIADALARAHGAGIIHRDLKPPNVMVDEHGLVKVLDFGLAKLTEAEGPEAETAATHTGAGTILGTAAYMSPEQAEGRRIDTRSDIFSFGSMLYEMLTGQRAFRGDTRASTIASILREDPKPISQVTEGLPHEVERIVKRCLRKDPEHRFQTMADLRVALEELKEESDSGTGTGEVPVRVAQRRWRTYVPVAAMLVLVAAVAVYYVRRSRTAAPLPTPTVVPLTSYVGSELDPCFSPDGKRAAFSWNGEKRDNYDIYIKQVGSEARHRLTTDPKSDRSPEWSPDDRWIAFLRSQGGGQAGIYLISPLGPPERKVAEFRPAGGMSWSPDGKWLAVGEWQSKETSGISLIPIEQGEKRKLTSNSSSIDHSPSFSPDGRFLAYVTCAGFTSCDVYLLELDSDFRAKGAPRRLTHEGVWFGGITWTRDARSLVYSASRFASYSAYLWRIPIFTDARPERLELAGRAAEAPAISRTGSRLAFVRGSGDLNIWRFTPGAPAETFTEIASTLAEDHPQFSPDGSRIAFASNRSGEGLEIWTCSQDGSNLAQLTTRVGRLQGSPRWSPDGRWIAFDSQGEDGHTDIYIIDAAGGQPRRITRDPSDDSSPSWSRDGKWIYFRSGRTGRNEIWRIRLEGGEPVQLTDNGGFVALESCDGKILYYIKSNTSPLFSKSLAGGPEQLIFDSVYYRAFWVVEDGIYHIAQAGRDGSTTLQFFEFATGKSRVLTRIEANTGLGLTVSPDRKTVLFTASKTSGTDLMLIENFR